MFGLGMGELLIIFILALLFIGPKKLPELAKSLGKGIREFQRAKDEILSPNPTQTAENQIQQATTDSVATQSPAQTEEKDSKSAAVTQDV